MSKVLIFIGGSCAGKSTTEESLIEKFGAKRIIQFCTRPKREDELDGEHYNFCTIEEFNLKNCLNVIKIDDNWLYGIDPILIDEIKMSDNIYTYSVINIVYANSMAQLMRNNNIDFSIILFDINKNIRHDMLKQRGLTEAEIEVRLNREDNYDVEEFYNYSIFPDIIYKSLAQDMGEDIVNQLEYLKNEEI